MDFPGMHAPGRPRLLVRSLAWRESAYPCGFQGIDDPIVTGVAPLPMVGGCGLWIFQCGLRCSRRAGFAGQTRSYSCFAKKNHHADPRIYPNPAGCPGTKPPENSPALLARRAGFATSLRCAAVRLRRWSARRSRGAVKQL